MKQAITARQIVGLLESKHSEDVFVPECKDGPTWTGHHFRLDAWVMRRSWSKFSTIGYEVKVSRSDFLRDTKMTEYLDLCNELYVVATPGVCEPSELAEGVGLIITSTNGTRLYTKRKAGRREVVDLWTVMAYILMSRAKIVRSGYDRAGDNAEWWRKWLKDQNIDRDIGRRVSFALSEKIRKQITEVAAENKRLRLENEQLASAKAILQQLGISHGHWNMERAIKDRMEEIESGYSSSFKRAMDSATDAINLLKQRLEKDAR